MKAQARVPNLLSAAETASEEQNYRRAVELLKKCVALEAKQPRCHHLLARAYWMLGEPERALEAWDARELNNTPQGPGDFR